MNFLKLEQQLKQNLLPKPFLLQFASILQMNQLELLDYSNKIYEENPVLERNETRQQELSEATVREALRFNARRQGTVSSAGMNEVISNIAAQEDSYETRRLFLSDQVERKLLPPAVTKLSQYLIELLNDDGYLAEDDLDNLVNNGLPADLVSAALTVVQSLEPAGIGARSLQESLLIQIARDNAADPLAARIVESFLSELSNRQYVCIARKMNIKPARVKRILDYIQSLCPRPGTNDSRDSLPQYIVPVVPDIYVLEDAKGVQIVANNSSLPEFHINSQYMGLAAEDEELAAYLSERLAQAKEFLENLKRRQQTLLLCGRAIVEAQQQFFSSQSDALNPLTMKQLAETLNLHPSTVSRCVSGKHLQCKKGLYPLRFFFSKSISDQSNVSAQAARTALLSLVRDENSAHPLSDLELTQKLCEKGYPVVRRTVAKYRKELGIPRCALRKRG